MDRFLKYRVDHLLFWLFTVFFHGFTRAALIEEAGWAQFLLELMVRNGMLAVVIYLNLLWIIPRFLEKGKYVSGIILLVLSMSGYVFVKNGHDVYLFGYVLDDPGRQAFFKSTLYNISIIVFYVAFSGALQLSKEWFVQRELIRKIEVEKLNTELEYLKAQINPHFLFNSLNTVYFQIDKNNVEARDTLGKFSAMLRFQLYECNQNEISLHKEVDYLKNYVDLQRLRKDDHYSINFENRIGTMDASIAPLLLIPFAENAFKHISHHETGNAIDISLTSQNSTLLFRIVNTFDPAKETGVTGIGLKNVRRRLELQYPGRHTLEITQEGSRFKVTLSLELK